MYQSGQIWDLGELLSPACLPMYLFGWPHGSKTKHVQKHRYMHTVQRYISMDWRREQWSSQALFKPHQHSQLWTTQPDLLFLHFIKSRAAPLSLPHPKHSLQLVTHTHLLVSQSLKSLCQSYLPRVPAHVLGSVCTAFTSDTSFFRLWTALTCWAVQLEEKERIPYANGIHICKHIHSDRTELVEPLHVSAVPFL